ncbi:D-alanine--D-alanine ligase family protein [Flammeovirga kamogawensis]|uniref:D-alanine--D-alanine ligase family protein n=1 Tax=Flammeovirga kamogawensis TaxID=373891 RepID=UPI001184114B|nr:D-alanine--D-alanine ligase [Flammeovirga kamogawensis]MBB6459255.1 D-alanine-D-alanine ligase [Flammeovirga kamogawensis]TRX67106.1 D-alanine--D-alanine ligase [Flammeovirga kamogawensis]
MIKVGIFFGGISREREISFAGGRTVYDNLDKHLFEPVPIFVDSLGNFIHLEWSYVYKGTVRDFYPPVQSIPENLQGFQMYVESLGKLTEAQATEMASAVGEKINPNQFADLFDFAFLALHGPFGEDGNLQGILEWYGIPYSGAGVLSSAIGIDKITQKKLFTDLQLTTPDYDVISAQDLTDDKVASTFSSLKKKLGMPLVVKAPRQGSSLGVSIVKEDSLSAFVAAAKKSLFIEEVKSSDWINLSAEDKIRFVHDFADVRLGIGLPVYVNGQEGHIIYNPKELLEHLDLQLVEKKQDLISYQSLDAEERLLIEEHVQGREFSCIVIEDENGIPLALPPTEIVRGNEGVFDYRSKYLPGMSRKVTPIDLPIEKTREIQKDCENLYSKLQFDVYARIDGFVTADGTVLLNDPNTTSGMMPSSFFFHQAAEIGLNPSQFLTFIIRTSLACRIRSGKNTVVTKPLLTKLDHQINASSTTEHQVLRVGVIMGGYSSERHISVESGRNIFEKLASSHKYEAIPIFLTGTAEEHKLFELPVNIMLKDNADDIKLKIDQALSGEKHPVLTEAIEKAKPITAKYAAGACFDPKPLDYDLLKNRVDAVFIALHGRPGEDGAVQKHLNKRHIPYNGSDVDSSEITIDKYLTTEILKKSGIFVAEHMLLEKADWQKDKKGAIDAVEKDFTYPIIAKPSDDGCSSAVMMIKKREQLEDFAEAIFRIEEEVNEGLRNKLNLDKNEEFPSKQRILIEELISPNGADHFLEITGGMLTKWHDDGSRSYEIFEPSEALASGEILSLEEKFLAGEGQNITPPRFSTDSQEQKWISAAVRKDLEKVAKELNVQGYCRIDAFVRIWREEKRVETIIIEVNSLPGMTPATCIFHQAAINGYKPFDFIDSILDYGIKRTEATLS